MTILCFNNVGPCPLRITTTVLGSVQVVYSIIMLTGPLVDRLQLFKNTVLLI